METQIDWKLLRTTALAVAKNAYVPYSKFHVGAAALVDDGRIITGCNVENASYGLTLCAECGLVSELIKSGGGRLVAVCTVGNGEPVTPCGRCRQLLWGAWWCKHVARSQRRATKTQRNAAGRVS